MLTDKGIHQHAEFLIESFWNVYSLNFDILDNIIDIAADMYKKGWQDCFDKSKGDE